MKFKWACPGLKDCHLVHGLRAQVAALTERVAEVTEHRDRMSEDMLGAHAVQDGLMRDLAALTEERNALDVQLQQTQADYGQIDHDLAAAHERIENEERVQCELASNALRLAGELVKAEERIVELEAIVRERSGARDEYADQL